MRRHLLAAIAAAGFAVAAPALAQMPQPLPPEVLKDAPDAAKVAYLRTHIVAQGPVTGGLKFTPPPEFFRQQLTLLGESHGSAAPHVVDLELLTLLNARAGVRDYLAEMDPLQAAAINAYLASGDETQLNRVFDGWRDGFAQWGSVSYRDKMKGIRALNQRVPAARRVRVHGLDSIQDWDALAAWMTGAGATVDAAALKAAKGNAEKAKLALAALPGATRADPALRAELQAGLAQTATGEGREASIFQSYRRLALGPLKGRRAYGMWGTFHTLQIPVRQGSVPFAAQVRGSDLPAAKSMQSIVLMALDSAVQVPAPLPTGTKRLRLEQFNVDGPMVKLQGSATLRAASVPHQVRIYDLGAPGSPFLTAPDFLEVKTTIGQDMSPRDPNGPRDFARYVGVYRNSDWAPPLEGGAGAP